VNGAITRSRIPRDAIIATALEAVFDMLGELSVTPRIRELHAQAKVYDHAVKHWTTIPPSPAQLDAMFDLVTDLHGEVVETRRSIRPSAEL
jgi:hypothetical protein